MVMTIMGFVVIGVAQLLLDTARTSFITAEKLEINASVRQFTLDMAENARAANTYRVYRSFKLADRDEADDALHDGMNGDFLLLISMQRWPDIDDPEHFTRLVGYFREADPDNANSEGPVRRFEINYHDPSLATAPAGSAGPYVDASANEVEDLIDHLGFGGSYKTVVQLSRGLSNGQLFFNYKDRSIIVKAEIIHGNAAKRITDTYNYTVSPRG
jgi:hypothetical protein